MTNIQEILYKNKLIAMIKKKRLDVVRGGIAIPLPNKANYYYMSGRKHVNGGIDLGRDPRTGLEVEDGEVVKVGKNDVKVYSSVPFLNGKSPAERVMNGDDANKVFNAQERFKDRNGLNDDGTKKKRFGGITMNNKKLPKNYINKIKEDVDDKYTINTPRTFRRKAKFGTKEAINAAETIGGYLPFVGTALDIKELIQRPSWEQAGWTALGLASDIALGGSARGLIRTARNIKRAKEAIQIANNPLTRRLYKDALRKGITDNISMKKKVLKDTFGNIGQNYIQNKISSNNQNNNETTTAPKEINKSNALVSYNRDIINTKKVGGDIKGLYSITSNGETRLRPFPSTGSLTQNRHKAKLGTADDKYDNAIFKTKTELLPAEEKEFQKWYAKAAAYKGLNKNPDAEGQDYDYRGFWRNENHNKIFTNGKDNHFSDKYKRPNHPTFSNQSIYSNNRTPGGEWIVDKGISLFKHNDFTAKHINRTDKYLNGTGEGYIIGTDTIIPNRKKLGGRKKAVLGKDNEDDEITTMREVVITPENNDDIIDKKVDRNNKKNKLYNSIIGGFGGDAIGLMSNIGGNIASSIINNRMLNKLKAPSRPVSQTANKLRTNYNINPQLDNLRETVARYEDAVNNNTASSRVALARNQQNRFATALNTNNLYATKENEETKLINADRLNQQEVTNKNVAAYNAWQDNVTNFKNNILEKKAENKVALTQGITGAVSDTIGNVQRRIKDDKTILANALSKPNLPIEEFYNMGLISKKAMQAYRKAYPLTSNE